MLEIYVRKETCGQNVYKFVKKVLDKAPDSYIQKLFRKKEIRINNIKKTKDTILKEGDIVRIYIGEAFIKDFQTDFKEEKKSKNLGSMNILFENDDVIFLDKPKGMLTQSDISKDFCVNDYLILYLGRELGFTPSTCNRLDRNTSGIVAAGKSIRGLQELSRIFREGRLSKKYLTLVRGRLDQEIVDSAYLQRDKSNISKINYKGRGSLIKTVVKPIEKIGNLTFCEVEIFGGKTHQIRAHLSSLGYPIYADRKYGDKVDGRRYLLHCKCLEFDEGCACGLSSMKIEVQLPKEFEATIRRLRRGDLGN